MHHTHRSTRTRKSGSARGLRMAAGLLLAGGSLCLFLGTAASASTVNGVATITTPGAVPPVPPLLSGGSTTPFTVALPTNAACSGDTATDGYHVYSYLVPEGTDVSTLNALGGVPPRGPRRASGSSTTSAPTTARPTPRPLPGRSSTSKPTATLSGRHW